MKLLYVLLLCFFISHLISFLCSILEAVLLSSSPAYARVLLKKRPDLSESFYVLKRNIDRPLAAILTFNTASHTFGAAGVGAIAEILYGDFGVTVVAVVFTLTMLYLTEMIPKTIGAVYWRALLPISIPIIHFMIKISYPFVASFEWFSQLFGRMDKHIKVTESEIASFIEEGVSSGILEKAEQMMIFRIFEIADSKVVDFMINRKDLPWIDSEESEEDLKKRLIKTPCDIYFVCREKPDEPVGFVSATDILSFLLNNEILNIKTIIRKPCYVHEGTKILSLLEVFNKQQEYVAFVVDEYGGVQGAIKLEDIFQEVVQDIYTSFDVDEPKIAMQEDGSWLIDGMVLIADLIEPLSMEFPDIKKWGYRTVAGFCLTQLQTIPKVGDQFYYQNYLFRIIAMEKYRISKVFVKKIKPN